MPSGDFSNAVWGGNRQSWDINEPIRILALPWLRTLCPKTRTKNPRVPFFLCVHTSRLIFWERIIVCASLLNLSGVSRLPAVCN
jgi:hypothetical protein